MKHIFLLFCLSISALTAQGQNKRYNQISLETGLGLSSTIKKASPYQDGGITSIPHIALGMRYMFDQEWGIKGQFSYDNFKKAYKVGTQSYRLDMQAVYNLGYALDMSYSTNERFGLLLHGGVGVTFVHSYVSETMERNGNIIFGVTPLVHISDHLALYGDVSGVLEVKKHFYYDGTAYTPSTDAGTKTAHGTVSFGLIFYLGGNKYHSDWY